MTAMTMRWCWGLLAILSLTMRGVAEEAANPKAAKANYARPFEPPTRPALIPLPPGAIEPQGWLRDWCLTARDGYTGHMDDVAVAFKQAWAADYKMTGDRLFWPNGGWPYEGGGYWFDGLVRLGYALHDESLVDQAKARLGAVIDNISDKGFSFLWWLDRNNPADIKAVEGKHYSDSYWPLWANGLFGARAGGVLRRLEGPAGHRGAGNRLPRPARVAPHVLGHVQCLARLRGVHLVRALGDQGGADGVVRGPGRRRTSGPGTDIAACPRSTSPVTTASTSWKVPGPGRWATCGPAIGQCTTRRPPGTTTWAAARCSLTE